MKKYLIIIAASIVFCVNPMQAQNYYWSNGKKIHLSDVKDEYTIRLTTNAADSSISKYVNDIAYLNENTIIVHGVKIHH